MLECMETDKPLISVIMGTLGKREKLPLVKMATRSILNQNFVNFEFIICDDGSDSEVSDYLDKIALIDSRIKLVRSGRKYALAEKLNFCIEQSIGEYIARMDDDDVSHTDRLKKQIEFLTKETRISFVGCNVNLSDSGVIVGKRIFPEYPKIDDFFFNQPFVHPTLMFRREALLAVNGYCEEKRCFLCEDYDLLLRLYHADLTGANLQESLFDYTLSDTAKGRKKFRYRINEARTRYIRFRELKCLPKAFVYVIKPLVVGIIPFRLLIRIKKLKGQKSK